MFFPWGTPGNLVSYIIDYLSQTSNNIQFMQSRSSIIVHLYIMIDVRIRRVGIVDYYFVENYFYGRETVFRSPR